AVPRFEIHAVAPQGERESASSQTGVWRIRELFSRKSYHAPRQGKIIWRIDVEWEVVGGGDVDDVAGIESDEEASRPFVADELHRLFKQSPADENRIAAPPLADRCDCAAGRPRLEGADQVVNEARGDVRHVAEQNDG